MRLLPDVSCATAQILAFGQLRIFKGFGAKPEDCLLIGDSPADMEAGRRAGIRTCAVLWGYGKREDMQRWEPDYWIEHPGQLAVQLRQFV